MSGLIEMLEQERDMDKTELRKLANAALWTGRWYDAGCDTVLCTYDAQDTEHGEIAHPEPTGICAYLAMVQPANVLALLDEIDALQSNALSSAAAAGGRLRRNVRHLRLMRLCESNGRLNGCTGLRTIFPAR